MAVLMVAGRRLRGCVAVSDKRNVSDIRLSLKALEMLSDFRPLRARERTRSRGRGARHRVCAVGEVVSGRA
jgi:hypothetical protein